MGDEQPALNNGAVVQFQGGAIYWSPATGAHVMYGAIYQKYLQTAGMTDFYGTSVQSILGLPVSEEQPAANGGRVVQFQGGAIFSSPATGAHVMYGAIYQKYLETAGMIDFYGASLQSILGLPLSDEEPRRDGRVVHFQGGSIFWSPTTWAYVYDANFTPRGPK